MGNCRRFMLETEQSSCRNISSLEYLGVVTTTRLVCGSAHQRTSSTAQRPSRTSRTLRRRSLGVNGLLEELRPRLEHAVLRDGVVGVAGDEEDLHLGARDFDRLRHLPPGHPGHDHVGHHRAGSGRRMRRRSAGPRPRRPRRGRCSRRRRGPRRAARGATASSSTSSTVSLPRRQRTAASSALALGLLVDPGQVDLERRPHADLAVAPRCIPRSA